MIRLVIGSIVGGIAQWLVGFIFWGTPLAGIAFRVAPEAANAAIQGALAQNLTTSGTGTYYVPWPDTPQGTILHGRGPVALIHFNSAGFATMEPSSLVGGLILSIVSILLLALALWVVADRVRDFESRAKIVVLAAIATTLYFEWGLPVFNYYLPWAYFIYSGVADLLGFVAGGLVVARWFLVRDDRVAPPPIRP